MKIIINIDSCKQCPYCKSSSFLHDDAFTSAPYPVTWHCIKLNCEYLENTNEISEKCPFKGEK